MFTKPKKATTFDTKYSGDPAFDQEHPEFSLEKWLETRDEKYLPVKNGVNPVRYVFRRLRGTELERAEAWLRLHPDDHLGMMFELVVRALHELDGAAYENGDEVKLSFRPDREGCRRLDEASIEMLKDADRKLVAEDKSSLLQELGLAVTREMFGDPLA